MSRRSPEDKANLRYWKEKEDKLRDVMHILEKQGWQLAPASKFNIAVAKVAEGARAVVLRLGSVPYGGNWAQVCTFRVFEKGEFEEGEDIAVPELAKWAIENNRGSQEEYEASKEANGLVWRKKEG